jgi:hypothetical protein
MEGNNFPSKQLVKEMVERDLQEAKRIKLHTDNGYRDYNKYE